MYPPVPTGLPRTVPEGGAAICGSWVPQGVRVIPDSLCSILETPLRFCKYLTYS
jgi:hypothetical protein